MDCGSQTVRAKENLKLRHGGPSQKQASDTNVLYVNSSIGVIYIGKRSFLAILTLYPHYILIWGIQELDFVIGKRTKSFTLNTDWRTILNYTLKITYLTLTNLQFVYNQPRGTQRKSRSTITRHQEDKLSKATSSLFPIKMIAILEWT